MRGVACDQFFNGVEKHRDWAAQSCVYYDSAARMMKMAEGVECDKEIKAELTAGAAECVRRAKELRGDMAKPAGCKCEACKAKPPVKEVSKKKEDPTCHCVLCKPVAAKGGCTCAKCKPPTPAAGKCPVHPRKCTCKKEEVPKKEQTKKEAVKCQCVLCKPAAKCAVHTCTCKEVPKKCTCKKEEEPKKETSKKETPKAAPAPCYIPVCYPYPAAQWCYPAPMMCCVPAKK